MNPMLAGVIAGLMVPWFPNLLMLSILGVLVLVYYGWRKSAERRAYLIRLAITSGVALVLSSWYVIPLLIAPARPHKWVVADLFQASSLVG